MSEPNEAVDFVKKPSRRPQNLRKRTVEDEPELVKDETVTPINKRIDSGIVEGSHDESLSAASIAKLDVFYGASGAAATSDINKDIATATAEYDVDEEQDKARIEAKIRATNESKAGIDTEYRGQSGYRGFITIKDTARANANSSKHRVAGPVRASAHIRMTSRFDYAADLCKDYNETGFCGFGDSCKFVHDRGDYKSGWELEQEWEAAKQRELRGENNDDEFLIKEAVEEPIVKEGPPDTCPICSETFKKPIVQTKCLHYFCERCALQHSKTSQTCFVCSYPVKGQFSIYKPAKTA